MKITCPLKFKTSHIKKDVRFSGTTGIVLYETFVIGDLSAFGYPGTSLSLTPHGENKYELEITSNDDLPETEQVDLIEKLAHYLSLLMAEGEINQAYGTPYVDVCWEHLNATTFQQEAIGIFDSLSIKITKTFTPNSNSFSGVQYADILEFFYDGLRAESYKSKFFHWFLILESLEYSDLYKRTFEADSLFEQNEIAAINSLANSFSDPSKKSALINVLSRTALPRKTKLHRLLQAINVIQYRSMLKDSTISENSIGNLLVARNKLFHQSSNFDANLLWNHLFPIVREVVSKIISNPTILT